MSFAEISPPIQSGQVLLQVIQEFPHHVLALTKIRVSLSMRVLNPKERRDSGDGDKATAWHRTIRAWSKSCRQVRQSHGYIGGASPLRFGPCCLFRACCLLFRPSALEPQPC